MSYPAFIKTNWQWLITTAGGIGLALVTVIVAINSTYNKAMNQIDKVVATQVLQGNVQIDNQYRLSKLEGVASLKPQVDSQGERINTLEKFMLESSKDRAAMNAKLDSLILSMQRILELHTVK